MGTLRLILAISVVLFHTWPGALLVGGENAVRIFYVISGYLISFVLAERKSYASVQAFYMSRWLRLYPLYLVVALLSLVIVLISGDHPFITTWATASSELRAVAGLLNLTLLGQDAWLFVASFPNGTSIARSFLDGQFPVWLLLLVPQAWTLSLELCFYAIAPYVLMSRTRIWLLLSLSVLARVALYSMGLAENDPWRYRFFPAELFWFLLGALSHQYLSQWYSKIGLFRARHVATATTLSVVIAIFAFPQLDTRGWLDDIALTGLIACALPLLFSFQNKHAMDRAFGELSYPIYIVHFLVLWPVSALSREQGWAIDQRSMSLITLGGSIVAAIILHRTLISALERRRIRLRAR